MKMYDKNGKLSIVAKTIFEANMKRLRSGENPIDIVRSMKEQVAVLEYNGTPFNEELYRRGMDAIKSTSYSRVPQLKLRHIEYQLPEWWVNQPGQLVEYKDPGFDNAGRSIVDIEYAQMRAEIAVRQSIIPPLFGFLKPKSSQPIAVSGNVM